MKYLEQLRDLEREKNLVGGQVPPKLTKPGFDGFVSAIPPPKNIFDVNGRASTPGAGRQESRRAEVLMLLERDPRIDRAFVTDTMPDGTVTIMLAIRDVGSGQLTIPTGQFGLAEIIKLFDQLETNHDRKRFCGVG